MIGVVPVRTRQSLYIGEMKFRKKTGSEVIDEMKEKVARLKLPKGQSFRTVLIHAVEVDPAVEASDYFDFIIAADDLVTWCDHAALESSRPIPAACNRGQKMRFRSQ